MHTIIVTDELASVDTMWFLPNSAQLAFASAPPTQLWVHQPSRWARIDGITLASIDPDIALDEGL